MTEIPGNAIPFPSVSLSSWPSKGFTNHTPGMTQSQKTSEHEDLLVGFKIRFEVPSLSYSNSDGHPKVSLQSNISPVPKARIPSCTQQ
jgi:hypothetical protein